MLLLSGVLGAASGWLGSSVSALTPNLPAGAIIVLMATLLFGISMFLGRARGIVHRVIRHRQLRKKVGRQHLLRAVFEILENRAEEGQTPGARERTVSMGDLLGKRSWSRQDLEKIIREAGDQDYVESVENGQLLLNDAGFRRAESITRNHRLWEMYLIRHADIAPSHVDRDADTVEHILGEDMVRELEEALEDQREERLTAPSSKPPRSPHKITSKMEER
jgi:manganese/zinc/iron transport system permease protein